MEPAPHGNSKNKENSQYVRTWQSTKDAIKEGNNSAKLPRECVRDVINDVTEDSQPCTGLGQLPRGRQQVKDMKRNDNKSSESNSTGKSNDPWYSLIRECKAQARCKNTAFIRDVRVGAEFNVTPISYENLLLETKQGQHPTLIGPVLVHEKKTKETYSLFCGALKTLKPDLANLLAYGTDDEEALSSAFGENFERATHLLCSIHLKKNVENRLVEMSITGRIKDDIVADIFG